MSDAVTISSGGTVMVTVAAVGPQGPKGEPGEDGGGIPIGGSTGQVLTKSGEGDFAVVWADPSPPVEIDGGTF